MPKSFQSPLGLVSPTGACDMASQSLQEDPSVWYDTNILASYVPVEPEKCCRFGHTAQSRLSSLKRFQRKAMSGFWTLQAKDPIRNRQRDLIDSVSLRVTLDHYSHTQRKIDVLFGNLISNGYFSPSSS